MDAAKQQNWDPSVQALVAFPDVLTRLNQDIRWTTDFGNAFLAQQAGRDECRSAVARQGASRTVSCNPRRRRPSLRKRKTGRRPSTFGLPDPGVVYVPDYNPEWVWGPPVYGYYPPLLYPGVDVGFGFFPGIDLGLYFGGGWGLWGGFGWGWGPNWFGGANHPERQLLPSLWLQRFSSAALAMFGHIIPNIGSACRMRIGPSRVVSAAAPDFAVPPDFRGRSRGRCAVEKRFRGGEAGRDRCRWGACVRSGDRRRRS